MRDRAYDTDSYALEAGYRFHCAAHRTNLETELSTSEVSDRSYPQASRNGWTADARAIYTVYMMIIESFRTHRHSRSNVVDNPNVLTIRRGYRIRIHGDDQAHPWEIWRIVNVARLHALVYQTTQRLVFTGNSSLLLHGIPTWSANPDVEVWPSDARLRLAPNRAVHHPHTTVPHSNIVCRAAKPRTVTCIEALEAESPIEAAVRLALNDEPLEAFVAACMVMHILSRFDRFSLEESRQRGEEVRHAMLEELARHTNHHGRQRADSIIRAADAGCDNVFEASVLWVIKSLYSGRVVTQCPIRIGDHTYFGDIVLPDLKVIVEPDGQAKFGDKEQEVRENTGKWLRRQHDLVNAGWHVIRSCWQDTHDFAGFRTRLAPQLGVQHLKLPQDCLRLWAVPQPRQ